MQKNENIFFSNMNRKPLLVESHQTQPLLRFYEVMPGFLSLLLYIFLVGPHCILTCAKERRALPNQAYTCCLAMDGVKILASGFEKEEKVNSYVNFSPIKKYIYNLMTVITFQF